MKRLFYTILIMASALVAAKAENYFPYPEPPAHLVTLGKRTNYLVEHFWDRCDLKSAFSARAKLEGAFRDYVSFMPYAQADTVHMSIDALLDRMKKDPKHLLILGEIAEKTLYSDSAEVLSDEIYLPFAKAVASNKKIPAASRARFEHQAKVLENTQVGATMADFVYETPAGDKQSFYSISTPYTLLFINDPDCEDCALTRVRLAADYYTQQLINDGRLTILSIYPDEATAEWRSEATAYPSNWKVGAWPDTDDWVDMRYPPVLYFLDKDHKVVGKNLRLENVLYTFSLLQQGLAE